MINSLHLVLLCFRCLPCRASATRTNFDMVISTILDKWLSLIMMEIIHRTAFFTPSKSHFLFSEFYLTPQKIFPYLASLLCTASVETEWRKSSEVKVKPPSTAWDVNNMDIPHANNLSTLCYIHIFLLWLISLKFSGNDSTYSRWWNAFKIKFFWKICLHLIFRLLI